MKAIAGVFSFFLSFLLLAQIETTTQLACGVGLAMIGIILIIAWFYNPDPSRKKEHDLEEEADFFEKASKRAKKKRTEIAEQRELARQEGQSFKRDGKKVTIVKIDGEYQEEISDLRRYER